MTSFHQGFPAVKLIKLILIQEIINLPNVLGDNVHLSDIKRNKSSGERKKSIIFTSHDIGGGGHIGYFPATSQGPFWTIPCFIGLFSIELVQILIHLIFYGPPVLAFGPIP